VEVLYPLWMISLPFYLNIEFDFHVVDGGGSGDIFSICRKESNKKDWS
jgi:hypothetical protein